MSRLKYFKVGKPGDHYPAPLALARDKKQSGVYVIRDRSSKRVLYVGESGTGRLYSTCTRHFQQWGRHSFWGLQYGENFSMDRSRAEVALVVCAPSRTVKIQDSLIRRLHPVHNRGLGATGSDEVPF